MKYKYKALAVLVAVVTSILSPLLAWFWLLDVITDGDFSSRVDQLWRKKA